jgi:hypothetical protein
MKREASPKPSHTVIPVQVDKRNVVTIKHSNAEVTVNTLEPLKTAIAEAERMIGRVKTKVQGCDEYSR